MGQSTDTSPRVTTSEFNMQLFVPLAGILLAASQTLAQDDDCIIKNCEMELNRCLGMKPCYDALQCLAKCTHDDGPECTALCGWYDPRLPLHPLAQCEFDHKCLGP